MTGLSKNPETAPGSEVRPLIVGLYLGDYSHFSGLWRHWIPVLSSLGVRCVPLWDRSFLSERILRAMDLIVVPGGFCWSTELAFGGARGREKLRRTIERGLTYVGTCYGANVAMVSGSEKKIIHLGLVPGRTLSHRCFGCRGIVRIDYHVPALSYEAASQKTVHINGRLFGPGDYEVIGRFSDSQPGPFETPPKRSIAQRPAAIIGECGRGRAFLFASHPEMAEPHPYNALLTQVDQGRLPPQDAVRRCWNPTQVSKANMRLLDLLFQSVPRTASEELNGDTACRVAERAGLLAGAKELLKLRVSEIERSLVTPLKCAKTTALQTASHILERRVRQARHLLSVLDPDAVALKPDTSEATGLFFVMETFSCVGDHPGHRQQHRTDYQAYEAKRLGTLRGRNREQAEKRLAHLVIDKLDTFVQSGQGCVLRQIRKNPTSRMQATANGRA